VSESIPEKFLKNKKIWGMTNPHFPYNLAFLPIFTPVLTI